MLHYKFLTHIPPLKGHNKRYGLNRLLTTKEVPSAGVTFNQVIYI